MLPKDPLTRKIIDRLDRIDPKVLEQRFTDLSDTCDLYLGVLEEAAEGVLLINRSGALEWLNKAAIDLLGLPVSILKLKSKWLQELPDPALGTLMKSNLAKLTEKKTESISVLNPRERRLRLSFIPTMSKHTTAAILITDQTAGHSYNVERERVSRLEDLMNLTAGIAHEIGNPLNALSIHMQLLKKEAQALSLKNSGGFETRLQIMESEIKRLDQIIRSFLKATRRQPMKLNLENLGKLIDEVLLVLKPEADHAKVVLEFQDDKKIPPFLLDRSRLYQALLNLIKNGLEAMPTGGKMRLQLTHRGRLAALRIEDTGMGIREENLPLIFNAFYTTKETGTGLGLTSVLQSISEHGGKIDVASKPGKGSVFTILLPIRTPKLQISKAGG